MRRLVAVLAALTLAILVASASARTSRPEDATATCARHSSLDMLSPDEYEHRYWEDNTTAAAA